MADRIRSRVSALAPRALRLPALALALVPLLAACGRPAGDFGRPTGDFGRAVPSLVHDTVLPAAGDLTAEYAWGQPVSSFNKTDREATLRDRAWAVVVPPHADDWLGDLLVEGQRTRLLPELDHRFDPEAYYRRLRADRFRSSEARWNALVEDMRQDTLLVPPFCQEARRVAADDRARLQALDPNGSGSVGLLKNAYARIDENARVVDWVARALRFRLASYRNAIDRMAVETPTERLFSVNQVWTGFRDAVTTADCGLGAGGGGGIAVARPSRLTSVHSIDVPVPQK